MSRVIDNLLPMGSEKYHPVFTLKGDYSFHPSLPHNGISSIQIGPHRPTRYHLEIKEEKMSGQNVAGFLSVDEVRMKMQMSAGFLKFQKWLVIYNVLVDPRPISEIAKHTGLSEASVYRIISEYNDNGPESIEAIRKMGPQAWFEHARTFSM